MLLIEKNTKSIVQSNPQNCKKNEASYIKISDLIFLTVNKLFVCSFHILHNNSFKINSRSDTNNDQFFLHLIRQMFLYHLYFVDGEDVTTLKNSSL